MLIECEKLFHQASGKRSSREGFLGRRGVSFLLSELKTAETGGRLRSYSTITVEMMNGEITFTELCRMLCSDPWKALFTPNLEQYSEKLKEHLEKVEKEDRKTRRKAVKEMFTSPGRRKKNEIAAATKSFSSHDVQDSVSLAMRYSTEEGGSVVTGNVAEGQVSDDTRSSDKGSTKEEELKVMIDEPRAGEGCRDPATTGDSPSSEGDEGDPKGEVTGRPHDDDSIVSPRTAAKLEAAYSEQKELRATFRKSFEVVKERNRPWGLGMGSI